jgi:iron complex outermembrane receptor protein
MKLKTAILARAIGELARASSRGLALSAVLLPVAAFAADAPTGSDIEVVSVIGQGESRQVQRITPENQTVLPPGTSLQKLLNILPGVNAQSIDALGTNEQSMTMSLRGFNSTKLGYTLDGIPLGDSAYNNYNGLSVSRALISENLRMVELAEGIGSIGIPSTSNLGGTVSYTSNDPAEEMSFNVAQSLGSDGNRRSFGRFDSGEYNGFSFYIAGMNAQSELWNQQEDFNDSRNKQINTKLVYQTEGARITAFYDRSRTTQANIFYMSKDQFARGFDWDWGGYAPDWDLALSKAYCNSGSLDAARCDKTAANGAKDADGAFTGGQVLRNDDLYYVTGDFDLTDSFSVSAKAYHHDDEGTGNNWNSGAWSNEGTPQQLPLINRVTLYSIDRDGVILSAGLDLGANHLEAGLWREDNTSSASRYNYTDVVGPRSLDGFFATQPDVGVFDQATEWETRTAYIRDTITLMNDRLSIDLGARSLHATSDAVARPGTAKKPISPTSNNQFATGSLEAKDSFLPQAGVRFRMTDDQEIFGSYAENIAMFQGGFKLGPQAVSQATWDAQGELKPEESKSTEVGYRISRDTYQASAVAYFVKFDNRLLQYNPCDSRQPVGPTCGNRFYNVGSVDSKGVELTFLWTPTSAFNWYNSASFNDSTYNDDYVQGGVVQNTAGKKQVDTPDLLLASEASYTVGPWSFSLRGKYTGERFYTYTNDQRFGGFTTFDAGLSYDIDTLKGVRLSLNVTNLTDKRYESNLDNSVFAPTDPNGTIYVFHASAPRQIFGSIEVKF